MSKINVLVRRLSVEVKFFEGLNYKKGYGIRKIKANYQG